MKPNAMPACIVQINSVTGEGLAAVLLVGKTTGGRVYPIPAGTPLRVLRPAKGSPVVRARVRLPGERIARCLFLHEPLRTTQTEGVVTR